MDRYLLEEVGTAGICTYLGRYYEHSLPGSVGSLGFMSRPVNRRCVHIHPTSLSVSTRRTVQHMLYLLILDGLFSRRPVSFSTNLRPL